METRNVIFPAFAISVPIGHPRPFRKPASSKPPSLPPSQPKHHQTILCSSDPSISLDKTTNTSLQKFAQSIRGEWTGYEGNYTPANKPLPIQFAYLPEAFEEWNIHPLGFETNSSIVVRNSTELYRKFWRVLPSVSHFADMIDTEEELVKWDLDQAGVGEGMEVRWWEDGCFVIGKKKVLVKKESRLDKWPGVEFCLRWNGSNGNENGNVGGGDRRGVHVKTKFDFENARFVETLNVVQERYDTDYCDGANIDSSSGYIEGWTSENHNATSELLLGTWKSEKGMVVERGERDVESVEGRRLVFPRGLSMEINRHADDGKGGEGEGLRIRLGWMAEENIHLVVDRCYDGSGNLVGATRTIERRIG